jgi:hypothetical protein
MMNERPLLLIHHSSFRIHHCFLARLQNSRYNERRFSRETAARLNPMAGERAARISHMT